MSATLTPNNLLFVDADKVIISHLSNQYKIRFVDNSFSFFTCNKEMFLVCFVTSPCMAFPRQVHLFVASSVDIIKRHFSESCAYESYFACAV